jgi:folate-binding protein YgfZ
MPTAHLDDRAIVSVSGPDAEHFLQNIVTADLDALTPGEAKPSALLAPQGKILFDFLVSRNGVDAFRLECRADIADDFVRRLTLYKLRAKVEISNSGPHAVAVSWDMYRDPNVIEGGLYDPRFSPDVLRHYEALPPATETAQDWHHYRIIEGIAESGTDYDLGEVFPHDVLLDLIGAVGFKKGCYIGQEVVSRMQHRGTARRRVMVADSTDELPPAGTDITVEGRPIGTLASAIDFDGLAIVRIDKVADAWAKDLPILAAGLPLTLEVPELWPYTMPTSSEDA